MINTAEGGTTLNGDRLVGLLAPDLQMKLDEVLDALAPRERDLIVEYVAGLLAAQKGSPESLRSLLGRFSETGREDDTNSYQVVFHDPDVQGSFENFLAAMSRHAPPDTHEHVAHGVSPTDVRQAPIWIALGAPELGSSAVVFPRSAESSDDIILLPNDSADAGLLHSAIIEVLEIRRANQSPAAKPINVRPAIRREALSQSWQRRLEEVLSRLRMVPPKEHVMLGRVALVEFRILE